MKKEILTFKSGKFYFSALYDEKIMSPFLTEARVLYRTINDLPILPHLATRLEEGLIVRTIFSTAAIEGNPLKEEEVAEILSLKSPAGKLSNASMEIQNLKSAYYFIAEQGNSDSAFLLSEDLIKRLHELLTHGIPHKYNNPGTYRNNTVKVGDADHGGIYTPPKILKDIKTLMGAFVEWINSDEIINMDPMLRAILAHYHLGLIHPFADGNGRTARLIEALLLKTSGIRYVPTMLSNYYYRNIDDYFRAFSSTQKNKDRQVTLFVSFAFNGVITSLEEIKERITFYLRIFTLRDYYSHLREMKALTQRQYDLMMALLEYKQTFTLLDLLTKPPFIALYRDISERSARRDLTKLFRMKLVISEGKAYRLNLRGLEDDVPSAY